ncbi:hypothetical protein Vretimale_8291, partial [Volvox reticuliferus]
YNQECMADITELTRAIYTYTSICRIHVVCLSHLVFSNDGRFREGLDGHQLIALNVPGQRHTAECPRADDTHPLKVRFAWQTAACRASGLCGGRGDGAGAILTLP